MIEQKGGLRIISNPLGASILINGLVRGKSPIIIENLTVGEYLITVEKTGYLKYEKNIIVEVDTVKEIHAKLQKTYSYLTMVVNPRNAIVQIDNIYLEKVPVNYKLDSGIHTLTVQLGGYDTKIINVELKPYERKVLHVVLQEKKGGIDISSDPSGATVLINGKVKGQTPIIINDLTVGSYLITVTNPDYIKYKKYIVIESDTIKKIKANLLLKPSYLMFDITPYSAIIKIDGIYLGDIPYKYEIAPGVHHIAVQLEGYYTKNFKIEVKPNEKKEIRVILDKKK